MKTNKLKTNMKKFISFISIIAAIMLFVPPPSANAQTSPATISAVQSAGDFAGYLGTLDTLTNTDTATYYVAVKGAKHCVSITTNVIKISGTVASTIKVYGSIDGGVSYISTPITTLTITDTTWNYGVSYTFNGYDKYKIQMITAGTQSFSQRTRMLWRQTPPGK